MFADYVRGLYKFKVRFVERTPIPITLSGLLTNLYTILDKHISKNFLRLFKDLFMFWVGNVMRQNINRVLGNSSTNSDCLSLSQNERKLFSS